VYAISIQAQLIDYIHGIVALVTNVRSSSRHCSDERRIAKTFWASGEKHFILELSTMMSERYRGTVKAFDAYGGGTIVMPDGREVVVRYSAVRGSGIRKLSPGAVVSFLLEQTRRGLYAVCVQEE
jgi:cold shock CspA family protein